MSKSIDERVVEMRFDNQQFERNVSTSLSTLEKLKRSLRLDDASKGLDEVGKAASRLSLANVSDALTSVTNKFSIMGTVGDQIVRRLTDQFLKLGFSITSTAKDLTIGQISAGFDKYEKKTSSVQTIMNATGDSIETVNKYLDKLMWYSDETSFGFTDMTQALGQLTSSGGKVDKLIPMIMGIGNATAFAGKTSAEFSRAIYNLNQSYSAGNLQYMDWRSLELAGIASEQLKQTFIDTAEAMGKIKKGQVTIANFGQTLKDRWADTEVMEAAFGYFSEMTEKAWELVEAGEYETATDAYKYLSTQYQTVSMKAATAAQEAKSFSEAIEATKDAVSSGWMKSFELIFGNYEEAKELWTNVTEALWDVFASGAEARNDMLREWHEQGGYEDLTEGFYALYRGLQNIMGQISQVFERFFPGLNSEKLLGFTSKFRSLAEAFEAAFYIPDNTHGWLDIFENVTSGAEEASKAVGMTEEEIDDLANRVLSGEFGNGADRQNALSALGLGVYERVQNRVNELLGDGTRLAVEYSDAVDDVSESTRQMTKLEAHQMYDEVAAETNGVAQATKQARTNVQNLRYTFGGLFAVIDIVRQAASGFWGVFGSKITGSAVKVLGWILNITGGIGEKLINLANKLRQDNFFTEKFTQLAGVLEKVSDWVSTLFDKVSQSAEFKTFIGYLQQLKQWFVDTKNWAVDKIVSAWESLTGENFKLPDLEKSSGVLSRILGFINGIIAKAKSGWTSIKTFFQSLSLKDIASSAWDTIKQIPQWISNIWDSIKDSDAIKTFLGYFQQLGALFTRAKNWALDKIAGSFGTIAGTKFSLPSIETASTWIENMVTKLNTFIESIKGGWSKVKQFFSGIDFSSISTALASAKTTVSEFLKGLFADDGVKESVGTAVGNILEGIKNAFANTSLGKLLAKLGLTALVGTQAYATAGLGSLLFGVGSTAKKFGKVPTTIVELLGGLTSPLKAWQNNLRADTLLKIALSVGVLAGSLLILSLINSEKLVGAATALMLVLFAFSAVVKAFNSHNGSILNNSNNKLKITAFGDLSKPALIAALAAGALMLAITVGKILKIISGYSTGQIIAAVGIMATMAAILVVAARILSSAKLGKGRGALAMITLALSVKIMVGILSSVIKLLAENSELTWEAVGVISLLAIVMGLMGSLLGAASSHGFGGSMAVLGLALSMAILIPMIKQLAELKDINKLWNVVIAISGLIAVMTVAGIASQAINPATMLAMAVGIAAIAAAMSFMKGMDSSVFWGVGAIAAVLVAFTAIAAIAKKFKLGSTFIKIGYALALVGAAFALVGAAVLMAALAFQIFKDSTDQIVPTFQAMAEGIVAFFDVIAANGASIAKVMAVIIGAILAAVILYKAKFISFAVDFVVGILDAIKGKFGLILMLLGTLIGMVLTFISENGETILTGLVAAFLKLIADFALAIIENAPQIRNVVSIILSTLLLIVVEVLAGLFQAIDDTLGTNFSGALLEWASGQEESLKEKATQLSQTLGQDVQNAANNLPDVDAEANANITLNATYDTGDAEEAGKQAVLEITSAMRTTFNESNDDTVTIPAVDINPNPPKVDLSEYVKQYEQVAAGTRENIDYSEIIPSDVPRYATEESMGSSLLSNSFMDRVAPALGSSLTTLWNKASDFFLQNYRDDDEIVTASNELGSSTITEYGEGMAAGASQLGVIVGDVLYNPYLQDAATSAGSEGVNDYVQGISDSTGNAETAAGEVADAAADSMGDETDANESAYVGMGARTAKPFASGINRGKPLIQKSAADAASSAKTSMNGVSFVSTGENVINGLIRGMDNKLALLRQKSAEVMKTVLTIQQKTAVIESPSKVTTGFGQYLVEGLIIGMQNRMSALAKAAEKTVAEPIDIMGGVAEQILEAFNGNLDASPVITPVLDLTNVQTGVGQINGLFGQRSMALSSEAIKQAAFEQDVISTIRGIRSDINTLGERISQMQLVLDSGTLVGEIINPIDQELGRRQFYAERGV